MKTLLDILRFILKIALLAFLCLIEGAFCYLVFEAHYVTFESVLGAIGFGFLLLISSLEG